MRGMVLTTRKHVAISPLTPPLMVISILGASSIDMVSCGSPSPREALNTRVIALLQPYQYALGFLFGPSVRISPLPQVDQLQ